MAKCAICQKEPVYGNKLSITRSHISKRTTRTWKPNLRSVKAEVAREGRNPRTGEVVKIAARKSVSFKAGSKLKEAVNK